jgi:hypothetical protein
MSINESTINDVRNVKTDTIIIRHDITMRYAFLLILPVTARANSATAKTAKQIDM